MKQRLADSVVWACVAVCVLAGVGIAWRAPASDPPLGTITVSEAVKLTETYSALPSQASKLTAAANSARITLRSGDLRALDAELAKMEAACQGHAGSLAAWAEEQMKVAILTDPLPPLEPPVVDPPTVPPVEPEPPIVVPPTIPPASGAFGATLPQPHDVWSIEFGSTPGDKAMHNWADNGGSIEGVEIVAGPGTGVSNFKEGTVQSIAATNVAVRAHATGTKWLARTYNRNEWWERCTFSPAGAPFSTEGHGRYGSVGQSFESIDCLNEGIYGNPIQLAYRPGAEAGGPVKRVVIRDRIVNCHKPVDALGNNSDRAGPLVALYGLGSDCEHTIILNVLQDAWPQVGPIVTCVPEGAKDPATGLMLPKWWTPDMWTDKSLDVTVDADILPPRAQELFRVAGVRTVSIRGKVKLRSPAVPRVLIDQQMYGAKAAERVVVDLQVTGPDGKTVACPIEWKDTVHGTTAGGTLVLQKQ